MKPFNALFVFIYYLVGFVSAILHPTEVIGMEELPRSGVLLCPNHSSNWDPILVALRLPVNYRLHIMAKEELFQSVKTAIQAIKAGDNLLIFPEGTVIRNGIGCADGLPAHAKGGVAMIGVRTGAIMVPVFVDGEKRLFHKTRIIFGKPYQPVYTGRHGTAEEMQKIADDILEAAYALGGQAVGGAPLCQEP